jgi:hypothetical protein
MRKRLLLLCAAALLLAQPARAARYSCEDICAELAAKNCAKIDSMKCNFYILGCLAGCGFAKAWT